MIVADFRVYLRILILVVRLFFLLIVQQTNGLVQEVFVG